MRKIERVRSGGDAAQQRWRAGGEIIADSDRRIAADDADD